MHLEEKTSNDKNIITDNSLSKDNETAESELITTNGAGKKRKINDTSGKRAKSSPIANEIVRASKRKEDSSLDEISTGNNLKKVKQIKVDHRSYTNVEGMVLTLGEGDTGQLGLGSDILDRTKPAVVNLAKDTIQVCAGGMHTVCLNSCGKVFTFGCNDEGALGRDTSEDGSECLPGEVIINDEICLVTAGDSHTAALSKSGQIYIWGTFRDVNGPLGLLVPRKIENSPVKHFESHTISKISSGSDHLLCLTESGEILSVGNSEQGQLGRINECFSYRGGRKGTGLLLNAHYVHFKSKKERFDDIWTGQYNSFARAKDSGNIYCWGLNNYGQLGFDDLKSRYVPELSKSFDSDRCWKKIASGQHHTIALDNDGQIYSLGRKEYGRLGHGEDGLEDKSAPTLVKSISSKVCTDISCGVSTSFAVADSGEIYGWGMGTTRQLAQKEEDDLFEPTEMTGKNLENRKGLMVSAGGQHTVLLVKDL